MTNAVARKKSPKGKQIGHLDRHGHLIFAYDKVNYMVHRLAWFHFYGEWPKQFIDHINCIKTDNRIENLRDVPRSMNAQNIRKANARSKTGVLGVFERDGRYMSQVNISGKSVYLGLFDTKEAAYAEYVKVKRQLHPGSTL